MRDLDYLLPLIQAGNREAFDAWAHEARASLQQRIGRFATAMDVEDVAQDTLLRIWQCAPTFTPDGRPNALFRFAVRCARNLVIDHLRRVRREPCPTDDIDRVATLRAQVALPEEHDPGLRKLIVSGIARLPSRPRAALRSRLGTRGALDDSALAGLLGMRPNTFTQNLGRARRLLASHLGACGVDIAAAA